VAVNIQKIAAPDKLTLDEITRFVQSVNAHFDTLKSNVNDLITKTTPADVPDVNTEPISMPRIDVPSDTSSLANFQDDIAQGFGPQIIKHLNTLTDEINTIKDILAKNNLAPG
jgi:hypothetical protein